MQLKLQKLALRFPFKEETKSFWIYLMTAVQKNVWNELKETWRHYLNLCFHDTKSYYKFCSLFL